METFLKIVAEDLREKLGNDMSEVAVVFSNKRASLFFNEYLAMLSDRPMWSPGYLSISELLQSLSVYKAGDQIKLICELYNVFSREMDNGETLDDFYFWGELLLADFDDVDKNLVDADRLFTNLKDLKEVMDGLDYLDEEQESAIQQFFSTFSIDRRTELKERFISIWDKLGNIYRGYKAELARQHIAYEGMIYRDGIEHLNTDNLPYQTYVFVGFNVLNKAEHRLFDELNKAGKALFYWDYDVFYTEQPGLRHEAGIYINRNLKQFTNELPREAFDNLAGKKRVRFIASSTENAQARFLPEWLSELQYDKEKENAVVLCNESLLLPVLHSIPEEVRSVNITMGFPLSQTPAYTFVNALIEMQTNGYRASSGRYMFAAVEAVLKHPYVQMSAGGIAETLLEELTKNNRFYPLPGELQQNEFLEQLFTPQNTLVGLCKYLTNALRVVAAIYRNADGEEDVFNQLYRESLFKTYTIINRMLSLLESKQLDVREDTFKRLVYKVLLSTNIPFHGEPAMGLQVMGVLETRNLDFKNIVIMSVNEGLIPKSGADSSFIPYSLRKAFGMTTVEHRDAIYAYYFYRMIQRAENVTVLYNTSSGGLNQGEASRYIMQLLVEWPHGIEQRFLEAGQSPTKSEMIIIEKTPEVIRHLNACYNLIWNRKGRFSPSALNAYLDCQMKFYHRYVLGIGEPKEINTEIDSSTFGSIFHRSVELVYERLTANTRRISKEELARTLKEDRVIQDCVDKAFNELFFHVDENEKPEYNGTQLINSKVIMIYVKQLLRNDMQYAPFEMVHMEKEVGEELEINCNGNSIRVKIGGYVDRMDSKEGTLRIVDYKTGGSPKSPVNVEQLFTPSDDRPGYIFQTFLYASIVSRTQQLKVAPALLYIHRASAEDYSPVIEMGEPRKKQPVDDFLPFADEFRDRLRTLLEEIFDWEVPFVQTENKRICEYCDYKLLCGR